MQDLAEDTKETNLHPTVRLLALISLGFVCLSNVGPKASEPADIRTGRSLSLFKLD